MTALSISPWCKISTPTPGNNIKEQHKMAKQGARPLSPAQPNQNQQNAAAVSESSCLASFLPQPSYVVGVHGPAGQSPLANTVMFHLRRDVVASRMFQMCIRLQNQGNRLWSRRSVHARWILMLPIRYLPIAFRILSQGFETAVSVTLIKHELPKCFIASSRPLKRLWP